MMKKVFTAIVALMLICLQDAGAIFFRHFLPEDGLSHPAVLSICQDSIGRLWFGTENGISIYDGNSFISIKPEDDNGKKCFNGNIIEDMICTGNGDVYFRTNEELVRFAARTGEITTIYDKPTGAIFYERDTLFAIDNNRLYCWKPLLSKLDYIKTLPFKNISRYIKDKSGRTWIACQDGLFCKTANKDYTKICPNHGIYSMIESSDNRIWIGSREKGLMQITPDGTIRNFSTANYYSKGFHSNDVRQIAEDKNGNIWFGTFNGLYCYNPHNDEFTPYLREEREGSLSHSSVYSIFIDNAGILWIGTYYGGVNFADISRNSFVFYPAADNDEGLSHPVVGNMKEDKKGNIWICTEGGGLNMLNPKSGRIENFKSSVFPYAMPHTNLKWIDYDKDNDLLYIGTTSKGLYSFDIRRKNFKNIIGEEEAGKAMAFINVVKRHGDRLFLSTREGVYVHHLATGKDSLLYKNKTLNFYPLAVSGNDLLIGGDDIYAYNMSSLKLIKTFELRLNEQKLKPLNIFTSPDGIVYASTFGQGIFKYDKQKKAFTVFLDNSSSLLNHYCYQMTFSLSSNIIVSGEKGINIISPEGKILETYFLGKNIPLTAIVRDCGLITAGNGTIYAGGTNGLMAFREKDISSQDYPENIYFSELYINGKLTTPTDGSGTLSEVLPYTDKLKLKHSQDRIDIRFASKYNVADFNITDYEYHLSGYDERWYQIGGDRITYTNLRPGRYILEVRNRYISSEKTNSCRLKITVMPPWFFSWIAIILYISTISGILYFFIRDAKIKAATREEIIRERREKENLMELNEAKLQFFTSISHEFKTPLTIMSGQIGTILHSYKLAPSVYNRMLKVMHQTKQLGYLVSDLIEFRKYEQGKVMLHVSKHDINDCAAELHSRFLGVAKQNDIDFSLALSSGDTTVWIDSDQIERTIMNLLSNAFKFTPKGGKIALEVISDNSSIYVHVKDTGQGISPEEKEHIFERFYRAGDGHIQGSGIGLSLAKEMVGMHHGTISVDSALGQGSEFIISLKKGTEHFQGDEKIIIEENTASEAENNTSVLYESGQNKEMPEINEEIKNKILIVEDNPELLDILYELFSPMYNTLKADNGREALEIIKRDKPDLVVSDILMPYMTGVELCSAIKSDIDLCHIPIVLLTALDMPGQQLEGLLQGADDYIGKPFDSRLLLARCNNIIRNRKNLLKQIGLDNNKDISMLATNKLDKEFLDKLAEIIEENIGNVNLNNDLIAEKMNMSRASFYNKFKNLTGETPNEYLNNLRLSKSTSMLVIEQGMSVADIAYSLGFNSANYFSRKFKEKFGISPAQYRQEKTGQ